MGSSHFHARGMFVVSEEEAAAIRTASDRGGVFAAAIELRRRFPGVPDNGWHGNVQGNRKAVAPPGCPAVKAHVSRED